MQSEGEEPRREEVCHGKGNSTPNRPNSRQSPREHPDIMSTSEGGRGKSDVVGKVALMFFYKSDPNADKGERVKNPEFLRMSLMDARQTHSRGKDTRCWRLRCPRSSARCRPGFRCHGEWPGGGRRSNGSCKTHSNNLTPAFEISNHAPKSFPARPTDPGIVYFADDDNTYDVELFAELRKTRRISMFPVGLIHPSGVSSPVLNDRGRVTGESDHNA